MVRPDRDKKRRPSVQTARHFAAASAPSAMSSEEIKMFRQDVLGVSQNVFAGIMNVAVQTVHAWEQGLRQPSGTALRLLHMASQEPATLTRLVRQRSIDSKITAKGGGN